MAQGIDGPPKQVATISGQSPAEALLYALSTAIRQLIKQGAFSKPCGCSVQLSDSWDSLTRYAWKPPTRRPQLQGDTKISVQYFVTAYPGSDTSIVKPLSRHSPPHSRWLISRPTRMLRRFKSFTAQIRFLETDYPSAPPVTVVGDVGNVWLTRQLLTTQYNFRVEPAQLKVHLIIIIVSRCGFFGMVLTYG